MWMKVDDGLHAHRKTRAVIKSHKAKRRDAAPMGIWVLAGSWAAQNGTDGWVPEDELDRWDEEWESLVSRLVRAGYWWPQERDDEAGYGFNDWHDYNDPADLASKSGTYGNHVRWHVNEKRVEPDCDHCPKDPDRGDIAPISGGDRGAIGGDDGLDQATQGDLEAGSVFPQVRSGVSGGDSGGDSRSTSGAIALPEPDPNPTRPQTSRASADAERMAADFADWYAAYPRKRGKGQALKAYKAARKKADADVLLSTLRRQTAHLTRRGPEYVPYPATWLNGERWEDQPDSTVVPVDPSEWMRLRPSP